MAPTNAVIALQHAVDLGRDGIRQGMGKPLATEIVKEAKVYLEFLDSDPPTKLASELGADPSGQGYSKVIARQEQDNLAKAEANKIAP